MIRLISRNVRMLPTGAGRFACFLMLAAAAACTDVAPDSEPWPSRVLVTNDNGIDDPALVELARAISRAGDIEVIVVASRDDRSGATNYMPATRGGRYSVERRDLGPGIEAYALDGAPADCVVFALAGPLRERPPDLVVSGINGGPNLGDEWFGSGTIGAARTAAYVGVPAVAVSGVENDDEAAVSAASHWVVELIRSDFVRSLEAPEYLTVSLPVGTPATIQGVQVVERAHGLLSGRAELLEAESVTTEEETWTLEVGFDIERAAAGTDVRAVLDGYIAIVPMRVDEGDPELAARLARHVSGLPAWAGAAGR